MQLSDEEYMQPMDFSHGSVHNQVVHMMDVDGRWFRGLIAQPVYERFNPADYPNREAVRARWDEIEGTMLDYLQDLTDARLNEVVSYDSVRFGLVDLIPWQVLLHVINHGTDHRAQLMATLHRLGAPTFDQDLWFFLRAST